MGSAEVHHDEGPWSGRVGSGRSWRRLARQTHNPLLRQPTRPERLVKRVALALLAAVTLATAFGCVLVYRSGAAAEQAQGERRPVKVTVVRQVESTMSGATYPTEALLEVTYRVDGESRVSTLPTLFGAARGSQLDAWVDQEGRLTSRPHTRPTTLAQTCLTAVGGLVLLIGLAVGGRAAFAAWSLRLRAQEWEAEWRLFDTGGTR
jgi:hypothetical protein